MVHFFAKENLSGATFIAVMGPPGSGKSQFIDYATHQESTAVGHNLPPCTKDIRPVRFMHPELGHVVLLDMPGFDTVTGRPEALILSKLTKWVEKTYQNPVKLTGVIYLHRISDNRVNAKAGPSEICRRELRRLCVLGNVVLATTMWGELKTPDVGHKRGNQLQKGYWKQMLEEGSTVLKFYDSFDSAWDIIRKAVRGGR